MSKSVRILCTEQPEDELRKTEVESDEPNENDDEVSWLDKITDTKEIDVNEPVSMAKIYAKREETVQKYKFRIGLLSSSLLENPEVKVNESYWIFIECMFLFL